MNHKTALAVIAIAGALLAKPAQAQLPPPPVSPAPVTRFEYDAKGNSTKTVLAPGVPGFGFATSQTYDRLDRMATTVDAKNGQIVYGWNGREDLTSVRDPRLNTTSYARNGLGDLTSLASPDTGTAAHTVDAAGNLLTRTDPRGVVATYTWDDLDRLTRAQHRQGTSTTGQRIYSWTYDQTGAGFANGIGRLTSTVFPEGTTSYAYDIEGRITSATQRLNAQAGANTIARTHTVGYTWDDAGKPTSLTYPSGRVLEYGYNAGELASLSLKANAGAAAVPLLSAIQWEPFGAPGSWSWHYTAGVQPQARVFDPYGRLVRYRLGSVIRDLSYDAADRISSYTHYTPAGATQTALDQSFGYDELGRLTTITTAAASWTIGYDANGNRTSVSLNGNPSTYTTPGTNNKVSSITNPARSFGYDAAGNVTTDSDATAGYSATINLEGRIATHVRAGVTSTYVYNGQGQRVRKFSSSAATSTVIFVYDPQGMLLGEYSNTGTAIREYVWMQGEPVAVFTPNGTNPPNIFFVHNDHLGTPRMATDTANRIRWRWMSEPFGTTAAENQPTPGQAALPLPLRMPGQVLDTESNLFYNWHRSYDSTTGRYTQSDPIGLRGGINTYAYVQGNPISLVDPSGLVTWRGWGRSFAIGPYTKEEYILTSDCACGSRVKVKVTVTYLGQGVGAMSYRWYATLVDKLPCPSPQDLAGPASSYNFGVAARYGFVYGGTRIGTGAAESSGLDVVEGLGASIGMSTGYSSVEVLEWMPCDSCEK